MSEWRTSACQSCEAPMVWVLTRNNKRMPVDAEPRSTGSFELRQGVGQVFADFVPAKARGGRDLYGPHFETCPHAAQHRRKRSGT